MTRGARVLAGLGRALLIIDRLAAAALVAGAAWVAGILTTLAWRESAWLLLVAVPAAVSVPVLAWHFLLNPRMGGSPARRPGRRRITIAAPGASARGVPTATAQRHEKREVKGESGGD